VRTSGQAPGDADPAGGPGRQGPGTGQTRTVTVKTGCAARDAETGGSQPPRQAERHRHLVRGLGRRGVGDGHGGAEGAAGRAAPGSGPKRHGAVADAPAGAPQAGRPDDLGSGGGRSAQRGAGSGAGQPAGPAVVTPDLAAGAAALAGEIDVEGNPAGLAGQGLQAVADPVHHDAVGGQRPLLGLQSGVAGLQQNGGAIAGGLPAQTRVPDRVDLHRADGRAAPRGRRYSPAEQEPGYHGGQDRDGPQPVNAPHAAPPAFLTDSD
jgi:hypothetical protein